MSSGFFIYVVLSMIALSHEEEPHQFQLTHSFEVMI